MMSEESTGPALPEDYRHIGEKIHGVGQLSVGDELLAVALDKDEEISVRVEALGKIRDAEVLKRIVLDQDDNCRAVVLENIEDEQLLLKVALDDPDEPVAAEAASMVETPDLLQNIATRSRHDLAREAATGKITDQDFLYDLVLQGAADNISQRAVDAIAEEDRLFDLLDTDIDNEVKKYIIYKCNDQAGLILFKNRISDSDLVCSATIRIKQLKQQRLDRNEG